MELFPFKGYSDYSVEEPVPTKSEIWDCNVTDDVIGLSDCKNTLKNWYTNNNRILLLIGPTGCGKTSLVNLFCKENDISVYDTKVKKDLLKEISLFLETNLFSKKQKKIILIDDYSTGQNSYLSITDIYSIQAKVLIISSCSRGSNLSDLKKNCEIVIIPEINLSEIRVWIKIIINSIKLVITESDLTDLINKCKSDKRILLNVVFFLKQSKNGGNISNFIRSFYKNSDLNLNGFITNLFKGNYNTNEIYNSYLTDGYLLSNIIHENYINYNDNIDNIAKSAESISYGETIFSDIFESNRTFIPQTHYTNSLFIPSYYSKGTTTEPIRISIINNRFNIYLNNKKIIDKINYNSTKILTITDILYIKKFLNQQLVKNKTPTDNQLLFLKNIMATFPDTKIERLELIYKHFSNFREIVKEPKTKNFTLKFKEKLNKLL